MSTIEVTVENKIQAKKLINWLNEIKFVKKNKIIEDNIKKSNVLTLNEILLKIKSNEIYTDIKNPKDFQDRA